MVHAEQMTRYLSQISLVR